MAAALAAALILLAFSVRDNRRHAARRNADDDRIRRGRRQRMEVASRLSFAVAVVAVFLLSCAWLIGASDGKR